MRLNSKRPGGGRRGHALAELSHPRIDRVLAHPRLFRPLDGSGAARHAPTLDGGVPKEGVLMSRIFLACSCPCGGRRVVLAYLTQPGPGKALLEPLGLASSG